MFLAADSKCRASMLYCFVPLDFLDAHRAS